MPIFGQRWNQLLSSLAEDEILVVSRATVSLAVVWGLLVNLVGDGFIKVKLRNEFMGAPGRGIGANFEVDVNRSALVPAGIDRQKFGNTVRVRRLIAAQKLFPSGIESGIHVAHIGINTEGIAVPNIDEGAAQRAARAAADLGNVER